ncbi:MAG: hypothetical protein AB1Z98_03710 [Nannocystaceae bacterium]
MRAPLAARRVLTVALLVLLVLHVLPLPGDPGWMLAGWLPWDLGGHLLWMLGAMVVVLYMTGPAWPDEPPPSPQPRVRAQPEDALR